MEKIKNEEVNM